MVQRQVGVDQLLAMESRLNTIPMRDLTINKKVKDDITKGLTESREHEILEAGQQTFIEDFTSSKIHIVDNLENITDICESMKSMQFNTDFDGSRDDQLEDYFWMLFTAWSTCDEKEKIEFVDEIASHEVNFFIYKRDKPFYDKFVKPLIMNKLEK